MNRKWVRFPPLLIDEGRATGELQRDHYDVRLCGNIYVHVTSEFELFDNPVSFGLFAITGAGDRCYEFGAAADQLLRYCQKWQREAIDRTARCDLRSL